MIFQEDKWLSTILEKPCAIATWQEGTATPSNLPNGFQFLKLPLEKSAELPQLLGLRFRVISVDVTLEMKKVSLSPIVISNDEIYRPARPDDVQGVEEIAASSFRFDRFHSDVEISENCAARIKKEWAGNFFKGLRGTHMYVAEKKGQIAAFLQILMKEECLIIDLIGVSGNYQGQGIARKLILQALNDLMPKCAKVGTQLNNTPSLKLYNSLGFQIETSVFVLHRHANFEGRS